MKNVQPTNKTVNKSYNRPSMRPAPSVTPKQHQRDWSDGGHVSYVTRVDEVLLEDKHRNQRRAKAAGQ
ncbi:hypothetical protein [Bradyrhizobium erythrophlei]|jgi:hypothetical protein|uniref:Uncharacterized protein n=1 Tax=Bradyrhizobium erythrophlei TaxID=1437360 RepID=A0A1M5PVL5_9BRAD|nr:hypothetical protein [Bradyrhizobium erythrophlei]SHH05601.1 hypothetical protein SAMN05443248_3521 [Bradyrhizobium erythrophlei]